MATIIDGKQLSEKILNELKVEISKLNYSPRLGIVLVGDDAASLSYVERKKKMGADIGVEVKVYKFEKDISTRKLREKINHIQRVQRIKGVIVQLPLPEHINTGYILNTIKENKDVDRLSKEASGKLYQYQLPNPAPPGGPGLALLPPTVAGIERLLEEYKIEVKGKHTVIAGYGRLVGKPASIMFKEMGATVSILDEFTPEEIKKALTKSADIVVSGVGKPDLITKDILKEGIVVIDAGTSMKDGKLVGDFAEDIKDIASYYTPVPGGIGPMTVAMLFYNLVKLIQQ